MKKLFGSWSDSKKKGKMAGELTQEDRESAKLGPVDYTIAQIVEKEEKLDDKELVAVIAAAIAAYRGQVSTDGFVVRSIRKSRTY